MKRLLLVTFCLGSTLLMTSALAGAKGPPPKANFSMTIDNLLSDGLTATVIRSDGLGAYEWRDGVTLTSSVVNFWPRTDLGVRNVSFNNNGFLEVTTLPAPIVNDTDTPPTGTTGTGERLVDPRGAVGLDTSMENMVVGSTQCGTFWLAATDSETGSGWRLPNFQYSTASGSGTSFVVAKRVDSTHWTVESDYQNLCSATHYPNEGMVLHGESSTTKGKTTTITHADGYYSLPFHLTYTLE